MESEALMQCRAVLNHLLAPLCETIYWSALINKFTAETWTVCSDWRLCVHSNDLCSKKRSRHKWTYELYSTTIWIQMHPSLDNILKMRSELYLFMLGLLHKYTRRQLLVYHDEVCMTLAPRLHTYTWFSLYRYSVQGSTDYILRIVRSIKCNNQVESSTMQSHIL